MSVGGAGRGGISATPSFLGARGATGRVVAGRAKRPILTSL
jgi:hypothetical protein